MAFAIACCAQGLSAQVPGKLRLLVDPGHNYQFKVDGGLAQQVREIELLQGQHQFRFWAPGRLVIDTTLLVVPDRLTNATVRLPIDPVYTAYRMELRSYKRKRRAVRMLPIAITTVACVWTGNAWHRHNQAYHQLQDDRDSYATSVDPAYLVELKNETIPQDQEELKSTRSTLVLATGVTALCAAGTIFSFVKSSKWERPVYKDGQKVIFDGLAFSPALNGDGWMFNLALKFK